MRSASFYYRSPVGVLGIHSEADVLQAITFHEGVPAAVNTTSTFLQECIRQFDEYFCGTRTSFSLPYQLHGTDFQQRIWKMVADIPFGKTVTYLDLAREAGDRNLIRAVGGANGANKLPILIPCHRVIGANGKLTGYAGGLWRKKWLLDFELPKEQLNLFASDKPQALLSSL